MTRTELLAELADVRGVIADRRSGKFSPTMDARVALLTIERLAELVNAMVEGLEPDERIEIPPDGAAIELLIKNMGRTLK